MLLLLDEFAFLTDVSDADGTELSEAASVLQSDVIRMLLELRLLQQESNRLVLTERGRYALAAGTLRDGAFIVPEPGTLGAKANLESQDDT